MCPDGYGLSDDCSNCVLSDICVADNPCQYGGNCSLTNPPDDYECSCLTGTSGDECQGETVTQWKNFNIQHA